MDVNGDFKGGANEHLSRLLESVVTSASDAVLITDAGPLDATAGGPQVVYVNEAFTRMTGYRAEEIIGRTPRILQSEQTDRAELDRIRGALERWDRIESELLNRTKDGREFWVQISLAPAVDASGVYTHWVSIQRDITRRRARELADARALQTVLQRLQQSFVQAPIGMATTDASGRLLEVNDALTTLLGADEHELVGRTLFDITHVEDRAAAREACASLAHDGGTSRHESRFVHAGGRVLRVVVHAALVQAASGTADHVILHVEDVSERHLMEGELLRMAMSDVLTQLPNRTMLLDRLAQAVARRNRDGSDLTVLFVDVDDFKDVNDRSGHAAGDAVLVSLARRLQQAVRPGDTVARIGGDEFVVLCERTSIDQAESIARRLTDVATASPDEAPTSVSIGIAVAEGADTAAPESLLHDADAAMYEAKRIGRGRWVRFGPEMRARDDRRRAVEQEIRYAIDAQQFVLHYQPQIDIRTGDVVGVEALVRWQHPTRGLLGPGEFVPVAERDEAIVKLGAWVTRQACADAAGLIGDAVIWVNLSARQLRPGLVSEVTASLRAAGLPPARLGLELTESVLLEDVEVARRQLSELRTLGVRLAIDDFGTGYSSLAYLADLPVSAVKVDRSFAARLEPGGRGRPVVTAILGMARALGLDTIVEGVETAEQFRTLQDLGVELAQGYLFGRPEPDLQAAATSRRHRLRSVG